MIGLLLSTILTSAADSLNPIAITQQFVLQGLVKKPEHIWYFILPTGIVNLGTGFLAYYGVVGFFGDYLDNILARYGTVLSALELLLGIAFLVGVVYTLLRAKGKQTSGRETNQADETEMAQKIKSVSPGALVVLGVTATLSELTTALPYFAFLAILLNYSLALPQLTLVLVVYNLIYMLPLMVMYFIYIRAQDQFDRLYRCIKAWVARWAGIVAPSLAAVVGAFLVYHALSNLMQ